MANEKSVMAVIRASRPSFRSANDKVAFAVHASFVSSGFHLIAAGRSAVSESALSSSSTDEVGIENWNELEEEYAFVYLNPEKGSKKIVVRCLEINGTLSVDAVAYRACRNVHSEFNVGDFVQEGEGSNYSAQFKNLDALVKKLDTEVLSKLEDSDAPKPTRESGSSNSSGRSANEPGNGAGSTGVGYQPRYVDPSEVLYGGRYPTGFPVGGGDLYPGPGAGMPSRGGFEGGSTHVGPNHRIFGEVGRSGFGGFPGGLPGVPDPRFGADQPFGRPPGARFDPYGPPGLPDFDPDFARRPQGPGRRIHPDLEQPGSGSDYI